MRKTIITFAVLSLFALPLAGFAKANAKAPVFEIPDHAKKIKDNVYSVGKKFDPQSKKMVEGYIIIEKSRKNEVKPDNLGKPAKPPKTTCYSYISRGAKWRTIEPWMMNAANSQDLDEDTLLDIVQLAIDKWNSAAGTTVLGNGTLETDTLVADQGTTPDGDNELYFADIATSNAIGVTIVWGIFGGPPSRREIVEWDQIYDDVDFSWSAEDKGVSGKMDFDNIATHEIGHSFGMGDLYDTACNQETMFGYAGTGETMKRDLNLGDIMGISKLY